MLVWLIFVITASFFGLFFHVVPGLPDNPKVTYEDLYKSGVNAYLENRWRDCISYLEKSLEDYIYYKSILIRCRNSCRHKHIEKFQELNILQDEKDILLTPFYETILKNALCLMKCQRYQFGNRPKTSKSVSNDFEKRLVYDYLQLCYFKVDEPEKAASAAYTFLIHNPGHEVMQSNLRFYMGIPDIDIKNVKYLETKEYQELYLKAAHVYTEKKYDLVIELMEEAVHEYLKAEEECRLLCEGPLSSTPAAMDLIISVAHHFTFSLRCKMKCPEMLANMYGQKHENFFPSHFHYLQFSYYKMKNLKKTCEAVASFMLLQPEDSVMLENKAYYSKQENVLQDWFTPRLEIIQYHKRLMKEKEVLKFIEDSFQFPINETLFQDTALAQEPVPPPGPIISNNNHATINQTKVMSKEEHTRWMKSQGINVVMKDKDLNGSLRVAVDGLASAEDCEKLILMASDGAIHGDGYNGKHSPHTEFEMFEGLTVTRAATLAQRDVINPVAAQLFLNVSEKARHYVETYFNLKSELYFAYTHLVCRTALPDSPGQRTDLSHPVHADNCVLTNTGDCLKQQPAYTWRDYSAIVYLNSDFEGGEFIFAKDKITVQASVKPKCGRMVAFSAGKENLHGVKAVKKGRRCALAMWYTLDAKYRERERDVANKVLHELIQEKHSSRTVTHRNSKHSNYVSGSKENVINVNGDKFLRAPDIHETKGYRNDHAHNEL